MEVPNTIIIESNKKSATEQEYESFKDGEVNTESMPIDRSSSWKSYVEHGLELNEGDQISIESSQINILGDANNTMEFTRGESNQGKDPLVDNRTVMNIGYYITNKHQNNFPLPLFEHQINYDIHGNYYGSPYLNNWENLTRALPIFAVEGARYNPDYHIHGAGTAEDPSIDVPLDIASWYLGRGSRGSASWYNNAPIHPLTNPHNFYLPWIQWIGLAPLQNGPYEIYKPNETRLYKHKYIPYDSQHISENLNSFYNPNFTRMFDGNPKNVQTESPYFNLTENIIDIEIPEGFTTPSSVGEFITTSFSELGDEDDLYDMEQVRDNPAPSIFKFTGAFDTQKNQVNIKGLGTTGNNDPNDVVPQVLERDKITDNINKTFTTARTVGGTILEDYLNGNFAGGIQFPFVKEANNQDANNRLFYTDILDGDIKQTATAIKFSALKRRCLHTDNIIQNFGPNYEDNQDAIVDSGNYVDINGTNKPLFGSQVVIFEDLPRDILEYYDGDVPNTGAVTPKFWLNGSGEREAVLDVTGATTDFPPSAGVEPNKTTVYNSSWRTCPPIAAQGLKLLHMDPFDLIPTNIIATTGSIALLKRIFNTGQYIGYDENENLLRRTAVNNDNISNALVCKFQIGATDDETTTTEGYYSTNQINLVCPAMANYYTNPNYNQGSGNPEHNFEGLQKLNNGKMNESYMILGEYNYANPQLIQAPHSMPTYAQGDTGAGGNVGKWEAYKNKHFTGFPTSYPPISDMPRLIGRCWWNKNVLDDTRITQNIRHGTGAVFPYGTNAKEVSLDVDSQKKGKDAKYTVELKTNWDDRLDPQSPNFQCKLKGHDKTEATSHFQFKCSVTNKYFDVTKLQGNVIKNNDFFKDSLTDENLKSIEKNGLGIVVVYLKPDVLQKNSPLYMGNHFLTSNQKILELPYICFVNMSVLYQSNPLNNKELMDKNVIQIPAPCIGELFGPSLSAQDNLWSKIVSTQKKQPNMRCDKVPQGDSGPAVGAGSEVVPASQFPLTQEEMQRFSQNQLIPPPNVYTYPSFKSNTSLDANALNNAAFYHMVDYIPYVKIGSNDANISFDDNFGRFSISNFHTPFYSGNKVNPYWVRLTADGIGLSKDADEAVEAGSGPQFSDIIKSVNSFCAAISTYKAVQNLVRVRTWNYADKSSIGWKYCEKAPCVPFSLVQSSKDIRPLQNTLSGIGILNLCTPYRNIKNSDLSSPTKNSQNINNLLHFIQKENGLQNISNTVLKQVGWKNLTPYQPIQYKDTLFSKMGYSLEQLLPFFGKQNNIFNRNNYNLYEGYEKDIIKKENNMVSPFTTNCFISGSSSIDFTTNFSNFPMKNLGIARDGVAINATAESDSLIAVSLPEKLAYSYLVVYSDILQTKSQYYGSSYLSTLPAIGYISRNYESADFFFSFSNDWNFYNDKKRILNEFTIDIRLPNGRKPPIADNSSILFKIVKKKLIGILKKGTNS